MPKFLWLPYVVVIIAAIAVDLAGHPDAAFMVSLSGTMLVLFGHIIYAAIDSKSRWPGLTLSQRLGRIFSFQR
jgi:hypothetical protein